MKDFQNLKVGDKVLLSCKDCIGWVGYTTYREETVERITPSGLIVVCGMKFKPDSGYEKTSRERSHICFIDDENARKTMEDFNRKKTVENVVNAFSVHDCVPTYEQALKIKEIMGWE